MQYSDKFCFTVLCAPVEREDAYTVANARISYDGGGGRWGVAAFVNNMFDEEYRVYAFDSSLFAGVVAGVYAKPRTWGFSATYRFGGALTPGVPARARLWRAQARRCRKLISPRGVRLTILASTQSGGGRHV